MNSHSPIAVALDELLKERHNLAARLGKVDAVISSMRDLFHLPAPPSGVNGKRTHVEPRPPSAPRQNGDDGLTDGAILDALQAGPVGPGPLAVALHADRGKVRIRVKQLEERGLVVSTGTTANRQIALACAATSAAKEVP